MFVEGGERACHFVEHVRKRWGKNKHAPVTLVVPSPTSASCTRERSTRTFAAGFVNADALQNGSAVVGHLHVVGVAARDEDLVLHGHNKQTKQSRQTKTKRNVS